MDLYIIRTHGECPCGLNGVFNIAPDYLPGVELCNMHAFYLVKYGVHVN